MTVKYPAKIGKVMLSPWMNLSTLKKQKHGCGKVIKIHESTEGGVLITKKLEKLNKSTIFSSYGRNNIFFYLAMIYISLIFFFKKNREIK